MIIKILTYASCLVAANAYLAHQHPGALPHAGYYNHNALASNYGYHGGYIANNYNHILPHSPPAVNPWPVVPPVHANHVNPHQYAHGGLIRPHATVPNYSHSTALEPVQQVHNNNHVVPPSVQVVNQPAPVRPINYQHRPVIPPVFSHHTSMFDHNGIQNHGGYQNHAGYQNHGAWAW